MTLYVLTYDVRAKNHDYTKLYELLRGWGAALVICGAARMLATPEPPNDGGGYWPVPGNDLQRLPLEFDSPRLHHWSRSSTG